MKKITDFVINKPKRVIMIALLLIIPTAFSYLFTEVNYDILTYLPKNLDSVKGEEILSDTYNISSATMVIVHNMHSKNVVKLKNNISQVKNVSLVLWADDVIDTGVPASILPDSVRQIFYSDDGSYSMMFVFFEQDCSSKDKLNSVREIKKLTGEECLLSGLTPISVDTQEISNVQMPIYIVLAVILALITMFVTMEYVRIPFLLVGVLCMAVIYNMGTNLLLGGVSYITQCIAAILQLAVTMDYSIFLVNRYSEERKRTSDKNTAMRRALDASMTSLTGSSMTTLFGFLALCFMQLTLGFNIGIVMAKGVLLGLGSVLIILPAFLLEYDESIYKKKHRIFRPDFTKLFDFNIRKSKALAIIFVVLLIPSVFLAANTKKYYNLTASLPEDFNSVQALNVQKSEFNMTTSHYIIVDDSIPAKKLLEMENRLQEVDGIENLIAYNIYLGTSLPDSIIPDEVKQLIKQDGYQIMIANSVYDAATDESNAQVDEMHKIIREYDGYGDKDRKNYITGEGAMYNDLIGITRTDFTVTSIISVIAIFILIAVVFKSWSIPVLIIASIEFAIMLNQSISTVFGTEIPFIAPTIISCVQLGATVDYAILLTSRFREELSKGLDKVTAIKRAAEGSIHSIFQSSLIFFLATFGVYIVSSLEIVKEICVMLARGSVISALVIVFFLTPLLYIFEGFIAKTTKEWYKPLSSSEPDVTEISTEDFAGDDNSFTGFSFSDDD